MSKELLKSLAQIIRQPSDSTDTNHIFTNLDSDEVSIINSLVEDIELNKYGREQANQRWQDMWNKLPILFTFVDFDTVSDFWLDFFEPQKLRAGGDQNGEWSYTSKFLEFLLEDLRTEPRSINTKKKWLIDLVRMEQAIVYLGRPILNINKPSDSRFKVHYRTLELEYNIPEALDLAKKEEDQESTSKVIPDRKKTYLLLVRNPGTKPDIYRLTEADYKTFDKENKTFSDEKKAELKEIGML